MMQNWYCCAASRSRIAVAIVDLLDPDEPVSSRLVP
jgi:hypothetical protein